jgi:serine/threonine protein kinase
LEIKSKKFFSFCHSTDIIQFSVAPEILKGVAYLGPGVDVWALGIILYCLVVGGQPWDADDPRQMMQKIQQGLSFPAHLSESSILHSQVFIFCFTKRLDSFVCVMNRFERFDQKDAYNRRTATYLHRSDQRTSLGQRRLLYETRTRIYTCKFIKQSETSSDLQ